MTRRRFVIPAISLAGLALLLPVSIVAHVGRHSPAAFDPQPVNEALDAETSQMVGLRFTDLEIPRNARILSAHVEFAAHERTSRAGSLTIHARAVDDAPPIARTGGDAALLPLTSAGVEWSRWAGRTVSAAAGGGRTPDLAPVFQEIVSRPGWTPGNAIVLVFSRTREGEAFEGGRTEAPVLRIELERQPG